MGRQLAEDYGARKLHHPFISSVCLYGVVLTSLCYFNLDFFETSAKCDDNISLVFKQFGNNYSSLLCTVCMYICMYVCVHESVPGICLCTFATKLTKTWKCICVYMYI